MLTGEDAVFVGMLVGFVGRVLGASVVVSVIDAEWDHWIPMGSLITETDEEMSL